MVYQALLVLFQTVTPKAAGSWWAFYVNSHLVTLPKTLPDFNTCQLIPLNFPELHLQNPQLTTASSHPF